MKLLPWIEPYWALLWQTYQSEKKHPHAWVISGPHGGGKLQIPKALAAHLLCKSQCNCGQCAGCSLLNASNHPDFIHLAPEGPGKALRVQNIRSIIEQLEQTPHQGGWRLVLIEDAESLNISSANALLKTLEEPPPKTVIVLLVAQTTHLPATILSRCQQLFVPLPEPIVTLNWLENQGYDRAQAERVLKAVDNAPNTAKEWLDDELLPQWQLWRDHLNRFLKQQMSLSEITKYWETLDGQALKWLLQWLNEQINQSQPASIKLHQYYQAVLETQRLWHMNLNKKLLIQKLLMGLKQNELN